MEGNEDPGPRAVLPAILDKRCSLCGSSLVAEIDCKERDADGVGSRDEIYESETRIFDERQSEKLMMPSRRMVTGVRRKVGGRE